MSGDSLNFVVSVERKLSPHATYIHDNLTRAGYLYLRERGPRLRPVARTVDVNGRLFVDLDDSGDPIGVEVIGRTMELADLAELLRLYRRWAS